MNVGGVVNRLGRSIILPCAIDGFAVSSVRNPELPVTVRSCTPPSKQGVAPVKRVR